MTILLIRPSTTRPGFIFPLGLGYIAAVLHKAGYKVNVLDLDALRPSNKEIEEIIRKASYDIFGISGLSSQYKDIKELAHLSKKYHPQAKVILGGAGFSAIPQLFMDKIEADIGVAREAEETILEILTSLGSDGDLSSINGIWYKKDGKIIATKDRRRIQNLDTIPLPAWELFDIESYIKQSLPGTTKIMRSMPMITSRGCPYECTYCFRNFGRETHQRSIENVIHEIKTLQSRYGINYISFVDELFNITDKYIEDFCDRLFEEKIKLKWDCRGRVNLVNLKLLKKMKKAGCVYMGFGVESANALVLKNMKKHQTVDQISKAIQATKKSGIKMSCSFMLGMTGETKETIKETVEFIKANNLHKKYGFFYTTPFPGTDLYREALKKGLIPDEEKYLESLGETTIKPYINLTEMSDRELSDSRELINREIRKDYIDNNPLWLLENIFEYYKKNGFAKTVKRAAEKIRARKNEKK